MLSLPSARFSFYLSLLLTILYSSSVLATSAADCACGFYDAATKNLFTESTIVYFNETDELPSSAFITESFEHRYDRGWNTLYRNGASESNVIIGNDTTARNIQSLQLYCNASTPDHLVVGASVRTTRQDIFFGSFRTLMRSPRKWMPGSAISMVLDHNKTERWDIDVMNMKNRTTAWVSMLARGEFPDRKFGVNYTILEEIGIEPWNYTEYRVDWTRDAINYYIGGQLQSSITKERNGTLPSTPAPFRLRHWSTGYKYSTQGPPFSRSEANVGWVRLFFNSSVTTHDQREAFDSRCRPMDACQMDDMTLRGVSMYPPAASKEWKQESPKRSIRWVPISIDIAFGFLSTLLLAKTINRRTSWKKVIKKFSNFKKPTSTTVPAIHLPDRTFALGAGMPGLVSGPDQSPLSSGRETPVSNSSMSTPPLYSGMHTPAPQYQTPNSSVVYLPPHFRADDLTISPIVEVIDEYLDGNQGNHSKEIDNPFLSGEEKAAMKLSQQKGPPTLSVALVQPMSPSEPPPYATPGLAQGAGGKQSSAQAKTDALPPAGEIKAKRVDYLAGFVGLSAILVTMNHFGLTFWAAVIIPSVEPHYSSETFARKTFATFFLDPLWIGPFLMISTRFLISNYLRTGKLDNMAQKITMRPFRLLIPIIFIAMLEYFLMDAGAITWLEYLPSITWSSWPFTAIPTNAGTFISQLLQLAYLIPNAAPQITYYYCTGVLWTIPVQLQGAWQTILAVIMVREIKTPWKRFGFYSFCIINHWYALSWGSYYYAGVMLADLDLTYKYTKWLLARPFIYYPLMFFMSCAALSGFVIDMVTQHTGVNYATWENSWHPDVSTGLTIDQAGRATYPDYFIPRLNGLISTVFMQALVEISPAIQKLFSMKVLQLIFPHVFTIYLIHGFIFWSVGSWLCVGLFTHGVTYWLCVLIVAIVCYVVLFASMPLLTPVIEIVGKNVMQSIWEHASQEPAPRRKTLWPFSDEIFIEGLEHGEVIDVWVEERETVKRDAKDTKSEVKVDTKEVSRFEE